MIITEINQAFKDIIYFDDPHVYFGKGKKFTSVTQFLGKYKEPFNKEKWLPIKAKQEGISVKELELIWDNKKILGTTRGSQIHNYVEQRSQRRVFPVLPDSVLKRKLSAEDFDKYSVSLQKLVLQCEKFFKDHPHLTFIANELVVGDFNYEIGGMIDALVYDNIKKIYAIYDWKTDKKLDYTNEYQNFKDPIGHLEECEINKYSLQVGLYKNILERNVDIQIEEMNVVWFNHNNENYEIHPLYQLNNELNLLLNDWMGRK